jgi:DNA-3-methyladenine glycosylase
VNSLAARQLPRSFYERPTVSVAQSLLGKSLVHRTREGRIVGRIVETEAYVGQEDLACHASKGKTLRNEVMFGAAGFAYVYLIYGMYHCLNLVTERVGYPAAVLIRAVEPVHGIHVMRKRRGIDKDTWLTNGPGKLCEAFGIDRGLNGTDLCGNLLFVEDGVAGSVEITASRRVGVDYAGIWKDRLWRFFIKNNAYVSKGS